MTNFVGIYSLIASTPIWVIAITLWICTDGAIHLLRDKLEGLGYQVSYSAKFGDAALIAAILIAATILQRGGTHIPIVLNDAFTQEICLLVCFGLGASISFITFGMRSVHVADIYHDVVIAPTIAFCAVILLPVVWYNAMLYESLTIAFAIFFWGQMVWIDVKDDRINQRQWLIRHGFPIKGETLRH
jgi:hypothetical protein